MNNVTPL